ncbi:FAD-dependent oxidoreductase [Specibacter sp. RAF43]|uniref:FAD-dependent oxidoreductase n=1 Tax=Specibacter sp. RAF43 TaxID=3233057 RepID=UPI003F953506
MQGHAEIAGAGLAGLSLGALIAERGWSVRLHERNEAVREIGAGIYLKPNGLRALAAIGVLDQVKSEGTQLTGESRLDSRGSVIESRKTTGASQIWSIPRETLIQIVHQRALSNGAEILTSSPVASASTDGQLILGDGSAQPADLVVAADGVGSLVRDALGFGQRNERLSTVATRYLVPTRDLSPEPILREYWSGARRIAFAPSGPDHTYIYVICRADDARGLAQPLDIQSWSESFPVLKEEVKALASFNAVQHNYPLVKCHTWSRGQVAIIGDAAHALPPTLGQGANLAMSNALGLARSLDVAADVPSALLSWERELRKYTEITQNWSLRYDRLTWNWPNGLDSVRKRLLWALTVPVMRKRIHVADRMVPDLLTSSGRPA